MEFICQYTTLPVVQKHPENSGLRLRLTKALVMPWPNCLETCIDVLRCQIGLEIVSHDGFLPWVTTCNHSTRLSGAVVAQSLVT